MATYKLTLNDQTYQINIEDSYVELHIPHNGGFLKTYETAMENLTYIGHYLALRVIKNNADIEDIMGLSNHINSKINSMIDNTLDNPIILHPAMINTTHNNFYYALSNKARRIISEFIINDYFLIYGYDRDTLLIDIPPRKIDYILSKSKRANENVCNWVCSLDNSNRVNLLNLIAERS